MHPAVLATRWVGLDVDDTLRGPFHFQPFDYARDLARRHLGFRFLDVATKHAGKTALRTPSECYTYANLAQRVREFSEQLRQDPNFREGSRVILVIDNSAEYIVGLYGTILAGGIAVPLHPDVGIDRLGKIIELVQPSHVVLSTRDKKKRLVDKDEREWPSTEMWPRNDRIRWDKSHGDLEPPGHGWATRPAVILFTSGSTGEPKGVMLSHRNLLANAAAIQRFLGISSSDRNLSSLPWMLAFGNSVLQSHLLAGAELFIRGSMTFPESFVEAMRVFEISTFYAIPDQLRFIVEHSTLCAPPPAALRHVGVAGGALSPELATQIADALRPTQLILMYGQTEATVRLAYLPPRELRTRPGSIGRGIPAVRLEIRDERGLPAPAGEVGELWARGPGIMMGYWNDSTATAEVLREGWLRTGDFATRDSEGWICLRGRKSSWAKIAGHRVHPIEVEDFIRGLLPSVDLIVVPFESTVLGTRLALFIRRTEAHHPSDAEITAFCRKSLPSHKVPSIVESLADFPRTEAGKINLAELAHRDGDVTFAFNHSQSLIGYPMSNEQLTQELLAYVQRQTGCPSLRREDDLFGGGHLDSLMVMDLLAFIEATYRVRLTVADMMPANLQSVQAIVETVIARGRVLGAPLAHASNPPTSPSSQLPARD